jgi:glycosyltransferase involved in cell wall biosynthesis
MMKKLLCASASLVIANSSATARHLPCSQKVRVVYNGIEIQKYDPALDSLAFRKQYGIPFDAPLVGMVGRLRPWKGPERFLEMTCQILSTFPEAHSIVVGGDPFRVENNYTKRLKRIAEKFGISNQVTFTGHMADVRPALAAMDVFVHPGDPEPFGRVNIEAMAMSRPVVAFAHGALPEIVIHGQTGLLVPPGRLYQLALEVVTLIQDPARRRTMGKIGRRRVETCFSSRKMVREVEDLYQILLANHAKESAIN